MHPLKRIIQLPIHRITMLPLRIRSCLNPPQRIDRLLQLSPRPPRLLLPCLEFRLNQLLRYLDIGAQLARLWQNLV